MEKCFGQKFGPCGEIRGVYRHKDPNANGLVVLCENHLDFAMLQNGKVVDLNCYEREYVPSLVCNCGKNELVDEYYFSCGGIAPQCRACFDADDNTALMTVRYYFTVYDPNMRAARAKYAIQECTKCNDKAGIMAVKEMGVTVAVYCLRCTFMVREKAQEVQAKMIADRRLCRFIYPYGLPCAAISAANGFCQEHQPKETSSNEMEKQISKE